MTRPLRSRRTSLIPAVVILTALAGLTGCGQQTQDTLAVTPADRSALSTCAHAAAVVDRALGAVVQVENGSLRSTGAEVRLSRINRSLTGLAASATDGLLQQSVQDLVDSITAYLAVLPDRTLGAYGDAAADVKGRLVGFRRICPVTNADFAGGVEGWAGTSSATAISPESTGHDGGAGLVLTNRRTKAAAIGVTDSPNWVDRTWRGSYRAGVWARAASGKPTLTLLVREMSGKTAVGEARKSIVLGPGWTFVGVGYDVTGHGGALDIQVTAAGVPPGAGVHIDGLAVARG